MSYCLQIGLVGGDWETMGDETYPTEDAARESLREFMEDVKYAFEQGFMTDDYTTEEFRIISCDDDQTVCG